MQTIPLYHYTSPDGGVTVSKVKPETEYTELARLVADEGYIIPAWEQPDSTNAYKIGDKVVHNEKTWTSVVDNNVWEPGVYGWEEVTE